jgi:DivIVA domain-containing protein
MGQFLLVLVVAIVAAAIVFGVVTLIGDGSAGMAPAEPDGRAVPLPGARPLAEQDVAKLRFDTTVRGYRMEQVDQALRRTAYDIGYKDELITVLTAEVEALRSGRQGDADALRETRERAGTAAAGPVDTELVDAEPEGMVVLDVAPQAEYPTPVVFAKPAPMPAPAAFAVPGDAPADDEPAADDEVADDAIAAADESDTDTVTTLAEAPTEPTEAEPAAPRNGRAKRASADRTR